jgi:hypothetical protein
VCVCVCFVAPIVSGAHVAKYTNFRNSTHTHDPALSHFPLHRYFQKSGTVPEFRINKLRLDNKLLVATLCVSYQVCRITETFHYCVMATVTQRRPTSSSKISVKIYLNFFYLWPQRPTFWQLSESVNEALRHDAHNLCASMRVSCASNISSKSDRPLHKYLLNKGLRNI